MMSETTIERVKKEILENLRSVLGSNQDILDKMNQNKIILDTPDPSLGDFSSPIAFSLAKVLKMSPRDIANDIKVKIPITKSRYLKKVEVARNGYLNFFLEWDALALDVLKEILEKGLDFGYTEEGKGKKVIVEHTSANPNKPIHMGTMRCAVIGDIIARVFRFCGHEVEVENYMDDLGRQIAVLVWKILQDKINDLEVEGEKIDFTIGKLYVDASRDLEENPEKEEEVREVIRKMEENLEPEASIAQDLVEKAVMGQLATAWRMNIFYDLLIWESDIIRSGLFEEVLKQMMKSKHVYKIEEGDDKGCIVLDMGEFGDRFAKQEKPYKIIVRSNGVTTYTGRDIGFHFFKMGLAKTRFKFKLKTVQPNGKELWETHKEGVFKNEYGNGNIAINVIGVEQDFPQQVVFHALKVLGHEEQFRNSYHLKFEHVWLPDQKFSGRKGTWIGFHADAALDKSVSLALEEVKKRHDDFSDEYARELAEKIGVGAVKYYLAKFKTDRKIVLRWEEVLNFEGNSCPYIQYAYVRTRGILNKTSEKVECPTLISNMHDTERALILHLA
ncbi:MAG: arginine--tRNA ligase, partial [Candidatus Helarchaeales archaeon]